MDLEEKISGHFEKISDAFDGVYEGKQDSFLYKIIDILFRAKILNIRKNMIVNLCGNLSDRSVLDIGCGPGRYSVDIASKGASLVVGIDISPAMVKLSQDLAVATGFKAVTDFKNIDFMDNSFQQDFDIIIASGVFDYVPEPGLFLSKICRLGKEKAIISFPIKWTAMTPLRLAWLTKRQCPSFYYTKHQIKKLIRQSGMKLVSLHRIGSFLVPGNYIVVCGHGNQQTR